MSPIEIKDAINALAQAGTWVSIPGSTTGMGLNEWKALQKYVSNLETCITQMLIEKYSQSK